MQLSPLAILIAVLIGASLAGILGALAAIPVAGAMQVILVDMLRHRRGQLVVPEVATETDESTIVRADRLQTRSLLLER